MGEHPNTARRREGAFVRRQVFALVLLALAALPLVVDAGNLYVLVSDEHPLRDIERVTAEVPLPIHVLDLSAIGNVTALVDEALAFVESLGEREVLARRGEIERVASEALDTHHQALAAAYRQSIVAGEIATRYGVEGLPAVIEIDGAGRYRIAREPPSLRAGILEIDRQAFQPAPPPLGARLARDGRAARSGENR